MPIIMYQRMPVCGVKGERLLLVARGVAGSFDLLAGYAALRMLPLSDAITIIFSSPVFVYIFAWIILKEEFGVFQIITVIITLFGVVLISKPVFLFGTTFDSVGETLTLSGSRTAGVVLSLMSCIGAAVTYIVIRMLKKSPTIVVVNSYSIASIIAALIAIVIIRNFMRDIAGDFAEGIGIPATTNEMILMIANGLCGSLGQLLLVLALKVEEASLVSLARTIDIVMAFVYQMIWLPSEVIHWTSIMGAVIVTASVSASTLRRWLRDKPGKWNTFWIMINCGLDGGRDEKQLEADTPRQNGIEENNNNNQPKERQ
jgi:drug/metabolite transporter (DMT)-like permease